jgi:LmbE family N-acetylglucosaminyl deacetylase
MLPARQPVSDPAAHPLLSPAETLSPLVIVSPHYEDAVFSCGHLLASVKNSTVLTVYTGCPENDSLSTEWDARCGFASAREAMLARGQENTNALAVLKARCSDLGFLDSQYMENARNGADLLGDTLSAALVPLQPASVFVPLGLFHEDHIQVADAMFTVCHRFPGIDWYAYEDIPYCREPGLVEARTSTLAARGIHLSRLQRLLATEMKAQAVLAYTSQLRGLECPDGHSLLRQPEQYWRIHPNMGLL